MLQDSDCALAFFREMVEPAVADFLARPDDRRFGCTACLYLSAMSDHYFHARPQLAGSHKDADTFRRGLGKSSWILGQIIGIANATKHVLSSKSRIGYESVSIQDIQCGNARCGWPIGGTYVMVESIGGELWLLCDLVEAAAEIWRDRLSAEGITHQQSLARQCV
jgi:hypothetical protein